MWNIIIVAILVWLVVGFIIGALIAIGEWLKGDKND